MTTVLIEVNADDIHRGVQGDCERCALARAAKRCLNVENVGVDLAWLVVYLDEGRRIRSFPVPPAMREFIIAYDAGYVVRPIAFELEIDLEEGVVLPQEQA